MSDPKTTSATPGHPRAKPSCEYCGGELVAHHERRSGCCASLQCIAAHRQQATQRIESEFSEDTRRDVSHMVDAPQDYAVVLVPSAAEEISTTDPGRIAAFHSHLREALEAAERLQECDDSLAEVRDAHGQRAKDLPSPLPVINACTACRGACCQGGGDHAYLDRSFLGWRMLQEPGTTAETLFEEYSANVPTQGITGSCIFHSPTGCALSREARASICNEFLCEGLRQRQAELETASGSIAVACEPHSARRLRILNADTSMTELPSARPLPDQLRVKSRVWPHSPPRLVTDRPSGV